MSGKQIGEYYVGLDCGTSSVGWAVTDPDYNLLRAKGKSLWGSRTFDEAQTAADRRLNRSVRRRLDRADRRLKLLRLLFRDEMVKVDPNFYLRLDESFYWKDDKNPTLKSNDTLFDDPDFHDSDYFEKYPTIWHLRKAIIDNSNNPNVHFDLRLYFLVIQHIYKHRGHFLIDGKLHGNSGNFADEYTAFTDAATSAGFQIRTDNAAEIEQIILDKTKDKNDKKRLLKLAMTSEASDLDDDSDDEVLSNLTDLAGLMIGSKVNLVKLFGIESDEEFKLTFQSDLDDKMPDIEQKINNDDYIDVILAAKRIYDYSLLKNLLGDSMSVSSVMVRNYELHQSDLKNLKQLFKSYPAVYADFFKSHEPGNNYNTYIGKAYTEDKSGRKKYSQKVSKQDTITQESLNKAIQKLIDECGIDISSIDGGDFAARLSRYELLPKQRGQAKGTIPQQLHHNELEIILRKLGQDYPSFAVANSDEPAECNTKLKKLAQIHSFRRPYYCGPLVKRKYDNNGNEVTGGKSEYSWADEEINEIVYPWNFNKLVNLEQRADNFINRMTNECTYLLGEDVLPKSSPTYQKYMVLNELNNLKFDGVRILDHNLKMRIYREAFESGVLSGSITLKKLTKWLKENSLIDSSVDVGGTSETKYLPKLSTRQDMIRCLGPDYDAKYSQAQIEEVVRVITVLSNDKAMLKRKLQEILHCSDDEASKLSRLPYKDWGKLSYKFLTGLVAKVGIRDVSIIEALEETEDNLMELLGGDSRYHFKEAIDKYNEAKQPATTEVTYADVQDLYCSPAVKRSVWQAVKIVKELTKIIGHAPAKIFLESTREDIDPKKKRDKMAASRRKQLIDIYRTHKLDKDLLAKLEGEDDSRLRSKKLYLYYCQMGKCAYTGEPINLDQLFTNAYDIDHIYPQSLTKDDSITRNKVLVKAESNRDKTNSYPIATPIREARHNLWRSWCLAGLITKEKYNRLTRATRLTDEELAGFIARQIVETSQTVKAIRDLFQRQYRDDGTRVIMTKAGLVTDLRKYYGYVHTLRSTGEIARNPEFIKVRALNDLHHAKDAYLNIVTGNTTLMTFGDNVVRWVQMHRGDGDDNRPKYSIKTDLLFRDSEYYVSGIDNQRKNWPKMRGWNYGDSLAIVSRTLKRNDVLWTRMVHPQTGQMSDLQIVGKAKDKGQLTQDGLLPIKDDARHAKTGRYGGYNSLKGAFFALIELNDKRKGLRRRIVQVPIIARKSPAKYLTDTYSGCRVIIPRIDFFTLLNKDGFKVLLSARDNPKANKFYPAVQLFVSLDNIEILKSVTGVVAKTKNGVDINPEMLSRNHVHDDQVIGLFDEITAKLSKLFRKMPTLNTRIDDIVNSRNKFVDLSLSDMCKTICELLKVMGCNAETGNLSKIIDRADNIGKGKFSNDITDYDIKLIHQSVTGLLEREIDLNTYEPSNKSQPNHESSR